ncbi:MAG TPA: efflux RND transporter periplasmic adaptor subunit, partial [Phycisphaerales bacterium]|nr:efflux RND transporter periplasmic adaptor subunit [Phycisphaerales bacterium]
APMLRTRRSDDRNLALRAWDSLMRLGSVLVGPRHTAWKLAALLALAGIVFVSTYQTTYRVGAEAVIEPAVRRVVSAPIEGAIARIKEGLEPGTEVREGEVLVQLDDQEWVLRRADAQSRYEQAVLQASEARRENDAGKAEQYMAQARRSEAEMRLYDHQIERAQIKAPIAGKVLSGKLEDRIGATVRVGDPLLEIAPLDTMVVLARVDERDIGLVAAAHERGRGTGRLATRSRPTEAFEFRVERIVPLAEAREGTNTFEVRATLLETAPWMQPGMEGRAKFDTERHSLLWIGTRRIADAVRLWLW